MRTILSASMSLNNDVGYLQTKSASLSAEKIHQKLLEEAADGSDSNSSSSSGCMMTMTVCVLLVLISLYCHCVAAESG